MAPTMLSSERPSSLEVHDESSHPDIIHRTAMKTPHQDNQSALYRIEASLNAKLEKSVDKRAPKPTKRREVIACTLDGYRAGSSECGSQLNGRKFQFSGSTVKPNVLREDDSGPKEMRVRYAGHFECDSAQLATSAQIHRRFMTPAQAQQASSFGDVELESKHFSSTKGQTNLLRKKRRFRVRLIYESPDEEDARLAMQSTSSRVEIKDVQFLSDSGEPVEREEMNELTSLLDNIVADIVNQIQSKSREGAKTHEQGDKERSSPRPSKERKEKRLDEGESKVSGHGGRKHLSPPHHQSHGQTKEKQRHSSSEKSVKRSVKTHAQKGSRISSLEIAEEPEEIHSRSKLLETQTRTSEARKSDVSEGIRRSVKTTNKGEKGNRISKIKTDGSLDNLRRSIIKQEGDKRSIGTPSVSPKFDDFELERLSVKIQGDDKRRKASDVKQSDAHEGARRSMKFQEDEKRLKSSDNFKQEELDSLRPSIMKQAEEKKHSRGAENRKKSKDNWRPRLQDDNRQRSKSEIVKINRNERSSQFAVQKRQQRRCMTAETIKPKDSLRTRQSAKTENRKNFKSSEKGQFDEVECLRQALRNQEEKLIRSSKIRNPSYTDKNIRSVKTQEDEKRLRSLENKKASDPDGGKRSVNKQNVNQRRLPSSETRQNPSKDISETSGTDNRSVLEDIVCSFVLDSPPPPNKEKHDSTLSGCAASHAEATSFISSNRITPDDIGRASVCSSMLSNETLPDKSIEINTNSKNKKSNTKGKNSDTVDKKVPVAQHKDSSEVNLNGISSDIKEKYLQSSSTSDHEILNNRVGEKKELSKDRIVNTQRPRSDSHDKRVSNRRNKKVPLDNSKAMIADNKNENMHSSSSISDDEMRNKRIDTMKAKSKERIAKSKRPRSDSRDKRASVFQNEKTLVGKSAANKDKMKRKQYLQSSSSTSDEEVRKKAIDKMKVKSKERTTNTKRSCSDFPEKRASVFQNEKISVSKSESMASKQEGKRSQTSSSTSDEEIRKKRIDKKNFKAVGRTSNRKRQHSEEHNDRESVCKNEMSASAHSEATSKPVNIDRVSKEALNVSKKMSSELHIDEQENIKLRNRCQGSDLGKQRFSLFRKERTPMVRLNEVDSGHERVFQNSSSSPSGESLEDEHIMATERISLCELPSLDNRRTSVFPPDISPLFLLDRDRKSEFLQRSSRIKINEDLVSTPMEFNRAELPFGRSKTRERIRLKYLDQTDLTNSPPNKMNMISENLATISDTSLTEESESESETNSDGYATGLSYLRPFDSSKRNNISSLQFPAEIIDDNEYTNIRKHEKRSKPLLDNICTTLCDSEADLTFNLESARSSLVRAGAGDSSSSSSSDHNLVGFTARGPSKPTMSFVQKIQPTFENRVCIEAGVRNMRKIARLQELRRQLYKMENPRN